MTAACQSEIPNSQSEIPAPPRSEFCLLHSEFPSLPPSPRDFTLHRQNQIEHLSTRHLAEKFKISQTRVRQIVARTNQWIAAQLPAQTELEQEQEARLAKALAADALQHQLELLTTIWSATHETKYHRQLLRVITAKARLATLPGTLDLLQPEEPEGEAPNDPSVGNALRGVPPQARSASKGNASPTTFDPIENQKSKIENPPPPQSEIPAPPHSEFCIQHSEFPAPPPSEDCSPNPPETQDFNPEAPSPDFPTPDSPTTSNLPYWETPDHLAGLKLFESRLLTLIQNTDPTDSSRLKSLNKTLAEMRQEITEVEPIIRANFPVATLNLSPNTTPNVRQESPQLSTSQPPISASPSPANLELGT